MRKYLFLFMFSYSALFSQENLNNEKKIEKKTETHETADEIRSYPFMANLFAYSIYFSATPSAIYLISPGFKTEKLNYGLNAKIGRDEEIINDLFLLELDLKSYYIRSKVDYIKMYLFNTALIQTGILYKYTRHNYISAKTGAGYTIHYLYSDTNGLSKSGYYEYKNKFYFDPSVNLEISNLIYITGKFSAFISGSYLICFEKNKNLKNITLSCGLMYMY